MASLREKYESIAHRIDDLHPVVEPLRDLFKAGKRAHLLAAEDASGIPYAPPAPATIERRGPGTVLVPHGDASRLIVGLTVVIDVSPTKLAVFQSWPYPWVRYHKEGTPRMPRRDPDGFRAEDRVHALQLIEAFAFGL